jgi:alcohol dehydrogenase
MLSDKVFEIHPGVRASFGNGTVGKLGKRIKALGKSSAFIVTDSGVARAGVVDRIRRGLEVDNVSVELFDGIQANPTTKNVEAGAAKLRAFPEAVVVAVGGGSVIDAAKAIALLAPNGGTVADFPVGCKPKKPGHTLVAVPTTAGTGSETNMFGVVTDPKLGRKILVAHTSVLPVAVVLDPELTRDLPTVPTATCGMDVLTHAIEAFTSNRANPFSDSLALRAMAMVAGYLPTAVEDGKNLEARSQMLLAAHIAGLAFSSSGLGICHAMGHPLSARLDVAHGQSLATLLPHVMRFNLAACEVKYGQVAIALGVMEPGASNADNAERAVKAVETLSARVGTARSAKELGVKVELLPTLVDDAMADLLMMGTPRFPEPSEVRRLYEAAL